MSNKNDAEIKKLLDAVEAKRKALGDKPKPQWKTNGIINGKNLNTLNTIDKCVEVAMGVVDGINAYKEACEALGVDPKPNNNHDALDDLKLRVDIIKYDEGKKQLAALEKKLKDLRSEDAKTSDALTDISKSLGL